LREKKGDNAVVESPVPFEVPALHEFEGMLKVPLDLLKAFGSAIDLNSWDAKRQGDAVAASTRSCGEVGAAETVPRPIPRPIVAAESRAAASSRCLSIEVLLIRASALPPP
jgi:hypothetical protein